MQGLRILSLQNNSLTHLPPEIGRLRNLLVLNLESNRLQQLPAEIGQLEHLEHLWMRSNRLADLPPQFANLRRLQDFNVASNPLGRVPEPIVQLPNLQRLILDNCGLTELPDAIGALQTLDELSLGSNNLERVPESLGRLMNLRRLYLDGNGALTGLPESILEMSQRCRVNVDGCVALPEAVHAALAAGLQDGSDTEDEDMEAQGAVYPLADMLLSQEQRNVLSTDQGEPIEHAASFFDWLDRMAGTSDCRNEATRAGLEARLTQLIGDMRADIQLRRTCFEIAFEALRECDDRVAVGFNQMHAVAMTARTLRPGIDEKTLIGIGIDMFVLDLVEKEARAKMVQLRAMAGRPGDEIETMLFFQTALRAPLAQVGINVPLPAQGMLFRHVAGVSDQELGSAAQRIRAVYQDGLSMPRFLVRWAPLSKYVESHCAEQVAAIEARYQTSLKQLGKQKKQNAISEGHYLTGANALMNDLAQETKQVRQRLLVQVVKRNLPRPSV